MKIGILGDEDSGKRLAHHLNEAGVSAEFISPGLRKNPVGFLRLHSYDILHGIYMRRFVFLSLIFGRLLGKATICHWEGTDVMKAIRETEFRSMGLILNRFVKLNIVFSENLQKELKNIGIDSVVWPIPVDSDYFATDELPPMPKEFSVLVKVADDQLYGSSIVFELVKDLPNVKFLVVSGQDVQPSWLLSKIGKTKNLTYLGWKDNMLEIYKRSTVLLRLTKHDGLSYMVIESLALGRQVVWSHNFLPHCHYVKNYGQVKKAILEIQRNPKLNVEGAQYVRKNFSSRYMIRELIKIYNKCWYPNNTVLEAEEADTVFLARQTLSHKYQ